MTLGATVAHPHTMVSTHAHSPRSFAWRATLLGLTVALGSMTLVWNTFYNEKLRWAESYGGLFWVLLFAGFGLAGVVMGLTGRHVVMGLTGRRISFWELRVVALAVTLVAALHLAYG